MTKFDVLWYCQNRDIHRDLAWETVNQTNTKFFKVVARIITKNVIYLKYTSLHKRKRGRKEEKKKYSDKNKEWVTLGYFKFTDNNK